MLLPIYIISLSQDYESRFLPLERSISSLQHCPSLTPRIHRVDAVHGRRVPPDLRRQLCTSPIHRFLMTPTMLGCAASHLGAWRMIADQEDAEWVLMLEDDVVCAPDMLHRLHTDILAADPRPADIVIVGSMDDSTHRIINQNLWSVIPYYLTLPTIRTDCPAMTDARFFFTTSSYMISRIGASKLLACLDGRIGCHIDLLIHGACYRGLCNAAILTEPVASTRSDLPSHNNAGFPWLLTWLLARIASPALVNILNQPVLQLGVPALTVSVSVLLFFGIIICLVPRRVMSIVVLWSIAEMILTRTHAWPTVAIVLASSIWRFPFVRRWWLVLWLLIMVSALIHLHCTLMGIFLTHKPALAPHLERLGIQHDPVRSDAP